MPRCLPANDNPNIPDISYPTPEHKGDCIVISSYIPQCITIRANTPPCIDIIGIQGSCEECNLPTPHVIFDVQEEHYEGETYNCTITNMGEFPEDGTFHVFAGIYQGSVYDTATGFTWTMPDARNGICVQIYYRGGGCTSGVFNLCTDCLVKDENIWEINGERFSDNADTFYKKFYDKPSIETFKLIRLKSTVTDMSYAWGKCRNMTSFECDADTSSITNMEGSYASCTSLTSFPLMDTSSVTNMYYGWYNCTSLTSFASIDTSSVTNMGVCWRSCTSLTSFPSIDTSSVTDMGYTWGDCTSLTSFPSIDTSSVTDMVRCWSRCNSLTLFPSIDTSSVTNMSYAWSECDLLTRHLGLSDCSNVGTSTFNNTPMCNGNAGETDDDGNLLCPYEYNKPCS